MSHIENVPTGSRVADSLYFSQHGTPESARALASGMDAFAGYLGSVTQPLLKAVLDAGMGFIPVTYGGAYNNGFADELAQLKLLGVPPGATVFLDMEGLSAFKTDPTVLEGKVNAWADGIVAAGYVAGLYVGVPQPLTSDELWKLRVSRYWKGQGSLRDRNNNLAEPTGCGFCMTQMFPSVVRSGITIDCSMVGQDFKGRTPTMVKA
jgi:hypothetical protein